MSHHRASRNDHRPARWLGRIPYRATPIAILNVDSGTVRTRRRMENCGQVYPKNSPADWLRDGHATAGITCIACRQHSADVRLDALPAVLTWKQIVRRMICKDCGAVGARPHRAKTGTSAEVSPIKVPGNVSD